jgi:hypothetical protein
MSRFRGASSQLRPPPVRAPLGRGSGGRFGTRRFRAKHKNKSSLSLTALSLATCHPPLFSVHPCPPSRLFLSTAARSEEQKQPTRRIGD